MANDRSKKKKKKKKKKLVATVTERANLLFVLLFMQIIPTNNFLEDTLQYG